jgi:hypothetical protein
MIAVVIRRGDLGALFDEVIHGEAVVSWFFGGFVFVRPPERSSRAYAPM